MVNFAIRGIRQTLPSGFLLGRFSAGNGQAELVSPADAFHSMASLIWAASGPPAIHTSGAGITNTDGTLSVEWNGGTVDALGSGLLISSTTLSANWRLGTVTVLSGLTLTSGTLAVTAAPQQWNAGTVTALGTNLSITGTTLNVHEIWNAGTVSTIGDNVTLTAGTLSASAPLLPLCNGDPGPVLMDDGNGQCIGVPI